VGQVSLPASTYWVGGAAISDRYRTCVGHRDLPEAGRPIAKDLDDRSDYLFDAQAYLLQLRQHGLLKSYDRADGPQVREGFGEVKIKLQYKWRAGIVGCEVDGGGRKRWIQFADRPVGAGSVGRPGVVQNRQHGVGKRHG